MSAQRKALIIANDEYEHDGLRNLLAPAADAEALGRVLHDPQIGDFEVQVIRNSPAHVIEAQIEDLFADSQPDDLLLLHYSGHGLKSESSELFLAASNTRPTRLRATAVSADFLLQCMRDSRTRSIVLFLDCCYAGAFSQGARPRAAGDINVFDSFPREKSGGRGRGVITASSAMEYAFDGSRLADDQHGQPSVFTSALVNGLSTGNADQDEDGWVSLAELYTYVYDKVRAENPHQTPGCQFDFEGELYLARSRRLRIRPARVPADLQAAIGNSDMYARLGAVGELRARLASEELPVAVSAYEALTEIARHDIQFVAEAATTALSGAAPHAAVTQLDFGAVDQGSVPRHQVVKLLGPPVARACTPRPSAPWIRVAQVPGGLDISVDTGGTGDRQGSIVLEGPTGRAVIAVQTTLVPAAPPTVPAPTFTPVPGAVAAAPAAAPRAASEASGADAPPAAAAAQVTEPPPRLAAAVKRQPEVRMPGLDPYLGIIRRPTRYYFGALVLLLITFCIVAAILLSETLSLDPDWAVVAVSGLGIVVALGDVRKNALTSSFLLWNLARGRHLLDHRRDGNQRHPRGRLQPRVRAFRLLRGPAFRRRLRDSGGRQRRALRLGGRAQGTAP